MSNSTAKTLADYELNWYKGTTFQAAPSDVYVALLTTLPTTNTGTGLVECSDSAYARQAVASSGWSAISQASDNIHDQISNTAAITFPDVAGSAVTVVGLAIYSALTGGNLLEYQSVTSQSISTGNGYTVGVGALVIQK